MPAIVSRETRDKESRLWHDLVMANLTTDAIEALLPQKGRRKRLSDGRRLYIVAMPSGTKRWECEITGPDGKEHRMGLGIWPEVGLDDARRKHADLLARLRSGATPWKSQSGLETSSMRTVGLFAGVGGMDLGLREGLGCPEPVLLCEILPEAQTVLRARFPGVPLQPYFRP